MKCKLQKVILQKKHNFVTLPEAVKTYPEPFKTVCFIELVSVVVFHEVECLGITDFHGDGISCQIHDVFDSCVSCCVDSNCVVKPDACQHNAGNEDTCDDCFEVFSSFHVDKTDCFEWTSSDESIVSFHKGFTKSVAGLDKLNCVMITAYM